jgi:hypothetical protein
LAEWVMLIPLSLTSSAEAIASKFHCIVQRAHNELLYFGDQITFGKSFRPIDF